LFLQRFVLSAEVIPRYKDIDPDFPDDIIANGTGFALGPCKTGVFRPFLPQRMGNVMGDAQKDVLRVNFDCRIKLEFHGASVTTDAGLLAYRELDDAFGLTDQVGAAAFDDPRT
jgi:hypothetical protein